VSTSNLQEIHLRVWLSFKSFITTKYSYTLESLTLCVLVSQESRNTILLFLQEMFHPLCLNLSRIKSITLLNLLINWLVCIQDFSCCFAFTFLSFPFCHHQNLQHYITTFLSFLFQVNLHDHLSPNLHDHHHRTKLTTASPCYTKPPFIHTTFI